MKNIDIKSVIIGVLGTALVFACTDSSNQSSPMPSLVNEAKASTGLYDWDNGQVWDVKKVGCKRSWGASLPEGRKAPRWNTYL